MKALSEIGSRKAFNYLLSSLFLFGFKFLIFPQLRRPALVAAGALIGQDTILHDVRFFNAYRTGFKGLNLGRRCFVGDECLLDLADAIILEDDVTLAERVTILTHTNVGYADHPLQRYFPPLQAPVRILRGAFVGVNSTILPGVQVGEGAFVAAGSLVNKDVPSWTLIGGVPAKVIRTITLESSLMIGPQS
jgi:acetyltransferase-like isoleucine patch superfamily enzyme